MCVWWQYLNSEDKFPPYSSSAIMDLKFVCVIVCLCALTAISTEAGIPKCCITTKQRIPKSMLVKVHHWYVQEDDGACDIRALVLYFKDHKKPICAPTKYKGFLMQRGKKQIL